jgi:hypothetical protein
MRRGMRGATVEENPTITPAQGVVKQFVRGSREGALVGPSLIGALRFADREVKAVSRAQRGRSNAERLERANANRTIESDGR